MKTKLILLTLAAFLLLSSSAFAEYDTLWTRYTHRIYNLEFSNDDSKIFTVGEGGVIIFDTESGEEIHRVPVEPPDGTWDGCYSDDGSIFIVARAAYNDFSKLIGYIDIFNSYTYEIIKSIELPANYFRTGSYNVRISSDNNLLAVSSDYGLLYIDVNTEEILKAIPYEKDWLNNPKWIYTDLEFSKDGKYLIYLRSDDQLVFQNTSTYDIEFIYPALKGDLAISDDGSLIAFTSSDETKGVTFLDYHTKEIIESIPETKRSSNILCFSPSGREIAVAIRYDDKGIKIYDITSLKEVKHLKYYYPDGYNYFTSLDYSMNEQYLAGSASTMLVLYDNTTNNIEGERSYFEDIYPNPTTNKVHISFYIEYPTELQLTVTDNNGKEIEIIHSGFYETGKHTIQYDSNKLPNGVYYLTLSGINFKRTYKMVKEG